MTKVLAILIDGFRHDYISQEDTPFLYGLNKNHPAPPLRPILGYSDSIRATIFSGVYPNKHNYWMGYKYSPESSPFGFFNKLWVLDCLPAFLRPWVKMALSRGLKWLFRKNINIRNIPVKAAHFFDYTNTKEITEPSALGPLPTLFDILRANELPFVSIDSSRLGWGKFWVARSLSKTLPDLMSQIDPNNHVIYMYFHYLDNGAHRYGTDSSKFRRELRDVDSLVKKAVLKSEELFPGIATMVFSDHGMVNAKSFVDFNWLVKDEAMGRDYVVTLDSTMVRLWYLKTDAKKIIRDKISELSYGHFLSENEKKALKINFDHSMYGEDIYLLDPPYNIFPNFISLLKPYAMHAYDPSLDSQQGILLFRGKALDGLKSRKDYNVMVDILPTILTTIGLDVPTECEGKSLV